MAHAVHREVRWLRCAFLLFLCHWQECDRLVEVQQSLEARGYTCGSSLAHSPRLVACISSWGAFKAMLFFVEITICMPVAIYGC